MISVHFKCVDLYQFLIHHNKANFMNVFAECVVYFLNFISSAFLVCFFFKLLLDFRLCKSIKVTLAK